MTGMQMVAGACDPPSVLWSRSLIYACCFTSIGHMLNASARGNRDPERMSYVRVFCLLYCLVTGRWSLSEVV